MSPIIEIQKRLMLLGRVRLGQKGPKGEPQKLDRFRFTSASRALLDAIASAHGGEVTEWQGAPDEGYFQVTTDATRLDIILPPVFSDVDGSPTMPYSQWFEMWSASGCQRRCDGETEALSGKPCMCDPLKRKAGAASECKLTTRVSFMLPDLPGLGVWRLDSHGWNAAVELPGTLDVLARAAHEQKFIPAVLSVQHRTRKVDGQTRRYIVPVIELPDVTLRQLASGDVPLALNAPVSHPLERPALPSGDAVLPADAAFDTGPRAGFGEPPALPPTDVSAPVLPDSASFLASDEVLGTGAETLSTADKLLAVATEIGAGDATAAAIERNRAQHAADPEKHEAWLGRQLKTAEKTLEQLRSRRESEFARLAAEAQARKAATA